MKWKVTRSKLAGTIYVPPSKSHTIRALLIASLADGTSIIRKPLLAGDGESALNAARAMGVGVSVKGDTIEIVGANGRLTKGDDWLDLGNSGTSTRLYAGAAALSDRKRWFNGDESLKERPMRPLLEALNQLGVAYAFQSPNRDIPFFVCGPIKGGRTTVSGHSSQFVSSLLLACPLAPQDSVIAVKNVNEKPYIEITLWWLDKQGINYSAAADFAMFTMHGGQKYTAFDMQIPGDFSSATFGAAGAALSGGSVTLENLDFSDPQGDKGVFVFLEALGARVERTSKGARVSVDKPLQGQEIDLNSMPDALPALAVLGCASEGETVLANVPQARIKETDRIMVMRQELARMGADIKELKDGLVIRKSSLYGAHVNAKQHNDHRLVMALALAGMISEGETIIDNAQCAAVTYPNFVEQFTALGANIEIIE